MRVQRRSYRSQADAGRHLVADRAGRDRQTQFHSRSACLDFDKLNGYLLALIALFMMLFYAAVVVTVCRDLISRLPNRANRVGRPVARQSNRSTRTVNRSK